MDFIISSNKIKKGENAIILDSNTYNGIKKIAAKVALDLKAVFGAEPAVLENKTVKSPIYAGTVNDALIKAPLLHHHRARCCQLCAFCRSCYAADCYDALGQ